jgi:hypothetical protein
MVFTVGSWQNVLQPTKVKESFHFDSFLHLNRVSTLRWALNPTQWISTNDVVRMGTCDVITFKMDTRMNKNYIVSTAESLAVNANDSIVRL